MSEEKIGGRSSECRRINFDSYNNRFIIDGVGPKGWGHDE